jgi:hypothetical protein
MQNVMEQQERATMSMPAVFLCLEGLALLAAAIGIYAHLAFDGWLFAFLLFAPDLSMIGYLRDARLGAFVYNLIHNTLTPTVILALSWWGGWTLGIALALILFAHIGLDRFVGYGLKYPTFFKDTHLNRV